MRKLVPPAFDVGTALDTCASTVSNEELKGRLQNARPSIVQAQTNYLAKGAAGQLFSVTEEDSVAGIVSLEEMKSLYTDQFVPAKKAARALYDAIKAIPKNGICPLCGQRTVGTLDHYLVKSRHAALTVTPINLIPACRDCNATKQVARPQAASDQTLHPYFDDVDGAKWLKAEVVHTDPPSVRFLADPPADWGDVLCARVKRHFDDFELASLYVSQAAVSLQDVAFELKALANIGGPISVRQHLVLQAESRRQNSLNSWQTAFYEALAASEWFHTVGVQRLP